MKVDVEVDGLAHLRDVLVNELPKKAQTRVMVRALKTAGRPMVKQIKSAYRALGGSGSLAQASTIWQRKKGASNRDTFASVELGPKRSNKKALARYYAYYKKKASTKALMGGVRHGHLVEFGYTHKGGKTVAGKGILGAAFDQHGKQAVTEFGRILGTAIEKEAERLAGKQKK